MPMVVKIFIVIYLFEEINYGYAGLAIVYNMWNWHEFQMTNVYKVTWTLGGFIFIVNHWLFTAHYMKVACLFKDSFS